MSFRLIYVLIFVFLISCSTTGQRSTANRFSSFLKSCTDLVSNLIFTKEEKTEHLLQRAQLEDLSQLSDEHQNLLREIVNQLPNYPEKFSLLRKINAREALDSEEVKFLDLFHFTRIDLDIHKTINIPRYQEQAFVGGIKESPITYGLEFELIFDEVPLIVDAYRLTAISEESWLQMPRSTRLELAKEAQKNANDVDHLLVKISAADERLPEGLFPEPHGTMEGNGLIFDRLDHVYEFMEFFNRSFGGVSWQGHVVHPNFSELKGTAGYTVFETDLTQLQVLQRNYGRYLTDEKAVPARNLIHHANGPLSENSRIAFQSYEADANAGLARPQDVQPTKAINGPSMRLGSPYGAGMVGYEHRQYHKRWEELWRSMALQSDEFAGQGNLSRYSQFDEHEQISLDLIAETVSHYRPENPDLSDEIELFFISVAEKLKARLKRMGASITNDVPLEQRFLYAFRDWENHPILKTIPEEEIESVKERIRKATDDYLSTIEKLVEESNILEATDETVRKLRVAIAKWANDIDLVPYFESYRRQVEGGTSPRGPPKLHTFPVIKDANSEIVDRGNHQIRRYHWRAGLSGAKTYPIVKSQSFEIIVTPRESGFSHIELRLGNRLYSFDNVGRSKAQNFSAPYGGTTGIVYKMDEGQMKELIDQVEKYYISARQYNIPPFDSYGGKLEVIQNNGKLFYKHDAGETHNKNQIKASLIEDEGLYFLQAENGYRYPVTREGDRFFTEAINCTSGPLLILKEEFGIDLGRHLGAGQFWTAYQNGQLPIMPEFEIQY